MSAESVSSRSDLQILLGPSPFVAGVLMWTFGVGYCVTAWHVNANAPLVGLALMGLAPFVNLFCFFRGLSCIRRAWLRWRTSQVAQRLFLSPTWGDGSAGFFLVDENKGFCVINGRYIAFNDIVSLKSTITFMAHTLEMVRRDATLRTPRLIIGFTDVDALKVATSRLHLAVSSFTNSELPLEEEDRRRD